MLPAPIALWLRLVLALAFVRPRAVGWAPVRAPIYVSSWAVRVSQGNREVERLARKFGFVNLGPIFPDGQYFHLRHRGVVQQSLTPHWGHRLHLKKNPKVSLAWRPHPPAGVSAASWGHYLPKCWDDRPESLRPPSPWYFLKKGCILTVHGPLSPTPLCPQITTDLHHRCTDRHTGTSASAPLAAGMIALALEANPFLTWRDMQHLVVRASKPAHLQAEDWRTNGVGRQVSHHYGYGLLDAGLLVDTARTWLPTQPQRKCAVRVQSHPCVPLRYHRPRVGAEGEGARGLPGPGRQEPPPPVPTRDPCPGTLYHYTLLLYGTAEDMTARPTGPQVTSSACVQRDTEGLCQACDGPAYILGQLCLAYCPPRFFNHTRLVTARPGHMAAPALRVCSSCHASCYTCRGGSPRDCTSCPPPSTLDQQQGSCVGPTTPDRHPWLRAAACPHHRCPASAMVLGLLAMTLGGPVLCGMATPVKPQVRL
uniref:Proprotein convertase subtilisin/kexin type 4 n=1 Tax=Nomascus leucogenys TaxID=61853 RepID=G1QM37_NOMLE